MGFVDMTAINHQNPRSEAEISGNGEKSRAGLLRVLNPATTP
jgi:hypothetical protein